MFSNSNGKMTNSCIAGFSKKAQMKIQQMAFMIVAITIFFSMVALVYFSITMAGIKGDAERLQDEEARAIVRKLAGSPEFSFTASSDCSSCIDLDKVYSLRDMKIFEDLWNLDHLYIEILYPVYDDVDCNENNYPEHCNKIVILNKTSEYATKTAFVALARWDSTLGSSGGYRYEFGKIHASAREPKN